MTIREAPVPVSPLGVKLTGRGAIAAYWLGEDNAKNRRRVTGLLHEVRKENRLPYGIDGDGTPFCYTSWLDQHAEHCRQAARSRAGLAPSVIVRIAPHAEQSTQS